MSKRKIKELVIDTDFITNINDNDNDNNNNNNIKKTDIFITNKIYKTKEMESINSNLSEECDIISGLCNINLEEKNIFYDIEKKIYILDNMYKFSLIRFVTELESLKNDYDKINPLNELMCLTSLGFFNRRITTTIRHYLSNDINKKILNRREININIDDIIKVEYNSEYEPIDLKINKNRFWFYSPKRFCYEFIEKCKSIINSKRKEVVLSLLSELEECITNNLVSDTYKQETLCWIDFYRLKYNEFF